jgi:hypothetical protein
LPLSLLPFSSATLPIHFVWTKKGPSLVQAKRSTQKLRLSHIGLDDRLVVLARTMHAPELAMEAALKESAMNWSRFGETCLGLALYKHRSFFKNPSASPAWSHLELSYFRGIVAEDAIQCLVVKRQPKAPKLLRAELLLTTPSSFVMPLDWQGMAAGSGRLASLEFIQVEPPFLNDYRNVMRDYCGPAAAKLVRADKFGTFRAMETAAVLYRDPELSVDWNQIHLCELNPDGFNGFGPAFSEALREDAPAAGEVPDVFAGLDRMRTVARWTFNDVLVEADRAVGQAGKRQA